MVLRALVFLFYKEKKMRKRDVEDSEDPDQIVQRVKLHDGFLSGTEFYWALPERKKRTLGLYGFDFLPKGLQALIAKMDAGGLLSLAQANRMFADIARNDQVWKDLFQRDFPHDWKYCQGELPFFVITEDHPLWQPGFINENDKSGWKRFYLNTRQLYADIGSFSLKNFSDVYNNYHNNPGNAQGTIEHCCYLFVCVMAYFFKGRGNFNFTPGTPSDAIVICLREINREEIGGTLHWLKKYVICSITNENFSQNYFSEYTNSEMLPNFEFYSMFGITKKEHEDRNKFVLFSDEDMETLTQFLISKMERPGIFIGFRDLEEAQILKFIHAVGAI